MERGRHPALQDFLDLAKMDQTRLGTDGRWGLTQVTVHDEMLLLKLLTLPNSVLWPKSRAYEPRPIEGQAAG